MIALALSLVSPAAMTSQGELLRYGPNTLETKASQSSTNISWFPLRPSFQNGTLEEVNAFFVTGGAYKLIVLRPNGYTWDRVYISPSNITATTGINTLTPANFGSVSIQRGDLVGFVGLAGRIAFLDADGTGPMSWQMSGEPAATNNTLTFSGVLRNWQFNYKVRGIVNPSNTIFDEGFDNGTTIPPMWENAATAWTFAGSKATNGGTGAASNLRFRAPVGNLSQWTWACDFTFDTSGSRFMMLTANDVQNTGGYAIELNSSTGNMVSYRTTGVNGWTNSGGLSAVDTNATGIAFATGTTYRMTITKNFRSFTCIISNPAIPAETFTYSVNQEDATNSSIQTRGFGYGKPGFAAITGTVSVLSTSFTVPNARPDWLFIGDSITEGSGTTNTTANYSRVIQAARGWNVLTSAQGGAGTVHVPSRLYRETEFICPRNVHFLLGTNDTVEADWQGKVGRMRDMLTGICTGRVVIGCIPPENPPAGVDPEAIATYIAAQGWTTVQHNRALTTGNTGLNADRNASLFFDTLHPNSDGHAAMATRFLSELGV